MNWDEQLIKQQKKKWTHTNKLLLTLLPLLLLLPIYTKININMWFNIFSNFDFYFNSLRLVQTRTRIEENFSKDKIRIKCKKNEVNTHEKEKNVIQTKSTIRNKHLTKFKQIIFCIKLKLKHRVCCRWLVPYCYYLCCLRY